MHPFVLDQHEQIQQIPSSALGLAKLDASPDDHHLEYHPSTSRTTDEALNELIR